MVKGIIVADGTGERPAASSWAPHCPALAPIVNRLLLERAIDTLSAVGADEIAVAADAQTLPRLRSATEGRVEHPLQWLPADASKDARSALTRAADRLGGDRFIVHAASGLWLGDPAVLAEALLSSPAETLMLVRPAPQAVAVAAGPGGRAEAALHDPNEPIGVHSLGAAALERIGAGKRGLRLADAIAAASGDDCEQAVVGDGWWDYSDADSLLEANRRVLEEITPAEEDFGGGAFIEGRVQIHPTADVRSSMIRGPVVIGAHATVQDAYVGPYTTIGETATIENAEIECSVVLTGARIRNVSVRIERSIIGQGAMIGRRFELPRTLRLLVGEDARISLG